MRLRQISSRLQLQLVQGVLQLAPQLCHMLVSSCQLCRCLLALYGQQPLKRRNVILAVIGAAVAAVIKAIIGKAAAAVQLLCARCDLRLFLRREDATASNRALRGVTAKKRSRLETDIRRLDQACR